MKTLVGKTFTIGPKDIVGPRQVACKGPKYQVKDYPADMLFQGAFGEMQSRDKSVDPAKVARYTSFASTVAEAIRVAEAHVRAKVTFP